MLLDVGVTVMKGVDNQDLTRNDVFLVTPAHQKVPLATQQEYEQAAGSLMATERRANMMDDSIDSVPAGTTRPCRIGFFTDLQQPARGPAFDSVELTHGAGCLGRFTFNVAGGIESGTHNLDVQFDNSVIQVPIEIMTEEQTKEFEKQWKEAEKAKKRTH